MLAQARAALEYGDAGQARERAVQLLRMVPDHGEARYLAGRACMQLRRWPEALDHLYQATRLQPRELGYIVEFAAALTAARRTGDALHAANQAMALAPADPLVLGTLGLVYSQCHAHERAASVFRRAATLTPGNPACRFNLGMALAFSGDVEASEAELDACLALAPTCWPAYNLRSRLRRQTQAANHVEALRGWLARAGSDPAALVPLHMALGKELEDLGEHAQAFAHFSAGKSAAPARPGYSIAQDEALVQALERAFATPLPQAPGCPTDEPVFVFGMPRSGTTLVERILTSHPEVHAAGELEDFPLTLERFLGAQAPIPLAPAVLGRARGLPWRELGEAYLQGTRPATSLKPRFVDKFPHNFLYAGFIAMALPNARLICLRRHPLDTCLGNFREPFSEASPYHRYAFDLLDIGRYYVLFDQLMAHWRRAFPGRILEVGYEELVAAPEATTRRLLAHCDLPWHDACLHFERNRAASSTASALQVRDPIHKAGVGRWKQYASQLAGLRELLATAGVECGE
jgi:tetratricopeptide (TPR) repeat protein